MSIKSGRSRKLSSEMFSDDTTDELEAIVEPVASLAGNQTVRYLWQQLSVYNSDLIQPFEDFLKSMVTEHQRAYAKCQDLDSALHSKTEQHERELGRIYDEMDQLLLREKDQLQEKHNEREEHQRCEFNRIIEVKENELQEALRNKTELESRLEVALEDYHVARTAKERTEKQLNKSVTAETHQRHENENLLQENRILYAKLNESHKDNQEMQEHLVKMTKIADTNKENYRICMQKFQDAIEEKETFDVNISNLTQELQDLRNANNILQERFNTSLNASIIWRDDQLTTKSPRNSRVEHNAEEVSSKLDRKTSVHNSKGQSNTSKHKLSYPNGSTPISKSNRSSLVSEKSFEEVAQVITPKSDKRNSIQTPNGHLKIGPKKLTYPNGSTPISKNNRNSFGEAKQVVNQSKSTSIPVRTPKPPVIPTGNEYKVIFVGDAAVGKSSLIRKICKGTFNNQRVSTTDPDCQRKLVTVGNRSLALNLWDTVGQERCTYILKAEGFNQQLVFRYNSLPPSYFRKADVVVLVYDLIKEDSFISIRSWMKTINEYTDDNVLLVLCGNKSDLDHRREVKEERARKLAKTSDAMYLETSARNGCNLSKLCQSIASSLMDRDDTVFIKEKSVQILQQDYLNLSTKKNPCC